MVVYLDRVFLLNLLVDYLLLLAARSDYIEVNGRRYPRTPVALSEHPVSDGGGYHALWGDPEGEEVSARAERAVSAASDTAAETQQAG